MQLKLGDDAGEARRIVEAEAVREATWGFVCDVFHHCARARKNGWHDWKCQDVYEHPLDGPHSFGTTCCGLFEATWPDADLFAVGRCDLAPHGERGSYMLVHNDLVRAYPLDPGSGSWLAAGLSFTGYCRRDGGKLWGITRTDFEACANPGCDEGRGVLLDFDGVTRTPPPSRPRVEPAPERSPGGDEERDEEVDDPLDEDDDPDEGDDADDAHDGGEDGGGSARRHESGDRAEVGS